MTLQKQYIVGIVAVLLVVGTGFYVATSPKESPVVEVSSQTDEETTVATNDENVLDKETDDTVSDITPDVKTSPISDDTNGGHVSENISDNAENVEFVVVYSEYAYDVGNTEATTEWASNIFLARITEKVGTEPIGSVPRTQYSANVVSNIKGNIGNQVVISQSGVGYKNGQLFVNEGDIVVPTSTTVNPTDVFLSEKGVYLFIAGCDERKWCTISAPPYDRELITTDTTLTDAQALGLARQNPRVQEFVNAARELGVLNPEWDQQ